MEQLFYSIAIYSAFAATSYLLLTKWRIIQYLQEHTSGVINKAVNCMFCCCFWLCFVFSLIGITLGADIITMLSPFAGAAVTRAIIG
ncbi:hypothetical protein B620_gp19 [Croceibacter phage P2559S]|uniref:hypothetical protein n=1 Tax=Croceibacter phage P2559S TaxID=1176422 RepID=UPI0002688EAE|nr:hypothetical protein B620_gp19 [Croceibacter phage P2559S]AFM54797.1 hypothetical protein P2559S_19 [Croceibacter phage P2559S]